MTSAFALVGAAAFAPAAAFAQDGEAAVRSDDEIVVTAQRREEKSVDVPITVTSLSAAALETANVQDLSDIAKITPGLRFDFASGYRQPTIRGVGTAVVSSGAVGNVGIYVDGFYSPNPHRHRHATAQGAQHPGAQGAAGHAVRPQHDRRRDSGPDRRSQHRSQRASSRLPMAASTRSRRRAMRHSAWPKRSRWTSKACTAAATALSPTSAPTSGSATMKTGRPGSV